MAVPPVVRFWVACDAPRPGAELDELRLTDFLTSVVPAAGGEYPLEWPGEMHLYAVATGGRDPQRLALRVYHGVGHRQALLWEIDAGAVDFGGDPTGVFRLPFRLRELVIPEPGQYEFVLTSSGHELAAVYLEARI